MTTYVWDNIAQEIVAKPDDTQLDEGWKLHRTSPNGVRLYLDDRGHWSLEVEAEDWMAAHNKFMAGDDEYVQYNREED